MEDNALSTFTNSGLLERKVLTQSIRGDETFRHCSSLITWWHRIELKVELQ